MENEEMKIKVGAMLVFGFTGYEVNDHARTMIKDYHCGNVILFARNVKNAQQITKLIAELQKLAHKYNNAPLFVMADQEGGSVSRLTGEFTDFPGAMATHAAGESSLAYEIGRAIGEEMAAVGFNFNLAPETDIANERFSAHISSRAYGKSTDSAIPYAQAFIKGASQYVVTTAKHFPGLGSSLVDLHAFIGENVRSYEQLCETELKPVKALCQQGLSAVMTNHEIFPSLDDVPSTISPKIINDLLKTEYGFCGLVISDCMEMASLCKRLPTPDGCVAAINAGVELLLICHTMETQQQSADKILLAVQKGVISENALNSAYKKILKYKEQYAEKHLNTANLSEIIRKNKILTQRICDRAIACSGDASFFNLAANEKFLFISPKPLATTMADEKNGALTANFAVKQAFDNAECLEYSFPCSEDDLNKIIAAIDNFTLGKIIFCTYNAHMDSFQQDLLMKMKTFKGNIAFIALRSPFDFYMLSNVNALFLYDYTPPMLSSLIKVLRGELQPKGKLAQEM